METKNKELEGLFARLEDLKRRAVRGDLGISAFLSPAELHHGSGALSRSGCHFFSFGGYAEAERQRIYVLPDYMENAESIEKLSEFGFSSGIAVLRAQGSGFENLSHRTFMGSILGLGIERSVIGDIVMTDDNSALVFCDEAISDFLLAHWERAGKDRIKLSRTSVSGDFCPHRSFLAINDTVASARLDCVVGALCSLSRERAREAVVSRLVELDYECEERPDREVKAPCVISVRGYGKFRVVALSDKTRKGRYRLQGEKFL